MHEPGRIGQAVVWADSQRGLLFAISRSTLWNAINDVQRILDARRVIVPQAEQRFTTTAELLSAVEPRQQQRTQAAEPNQRVDSLRIHLIRNTFRLASRRDWDALKRDVKPIYTAVNATAARAALDDLAEKWGQRYGAIIRLQENAWEEFIPFLDYDSRSGPSSAARTRSSPSTPATGGRSRPAAISPPSSALKCLYLVTRSHQTPARPAGPCGGSRH